MSTKIVPIEKENHQWAGKTKLCLHPAHNPPAHIVIPPGNKLVHTCPHCKETTVLIEDESY